MFVEMRFFSVSFGLEVLGVDRLGSTEQIFRFHIEVIFDRRRQFTNQLFRHPLQILYLNNKAL